MADEHHEIVIIRRGGHGDHDEHHGGVWKIAFADFMTAMMAFFLVMWLISANDKTRASVARYFNPVRLVDATTQPRGLHDTKKDESGITASPDNKKADEKKEKPGSANEDGKADKADKTEAAAAAKAADKGAKAEQGGKAPPAETPTAREARLDKALQDNPLVALAEIAGTKPGMATLPAPALKPALGRRGGDAYRDPFAPPPPDSERTTADAKDDALLADAAPPADMAPSTAAPVAPQNKVAGATTDKGDNKAAMAPRADRSSEPGDDWLDKAPSDAGPTTTPAKAGGAKATSDVQLKAMASALDAKNPHDAPKMDVKRTSEGLLISLTDTADYSMFASGSAVPSRQLVAAMETLAGLLKDHPGTIVLRGYTDNKPYRTKRYDNWHLSLDRAQVAHYMLVRGGLDDTHFGHVEGYADRQSRVGVDPSSPLNRRIDVLVRDTP